LLVNYAQIAALMIRNGGKHEGDSEYNR